MNPKLNVNTTKESIKMCIRDRYTTKYTVFCTHNQGGESDFTMSADINLKSNWYFLTFLIEKNSVVTT